MKEVVNILNKYSKTISTMESCTGGAIANAITNIEGASQIFNFGAVTYSNEYKIKMGVNPEIIEKYSVYSIETAKEMSRAIAEFTNADIGIGVTGKINREDINNKFGDNDKIYVSIFESNNNKYNIFELKSIPNFNREENKNIIIKKISDKLIEILK